MNRLTPRLATAVLALALTVPAAAEPLVVRLEDPPADAAGGVDLVSLELHLDDQTGDYELRLEADPATPFQGTVYYSIHLRNDDAPIAFQDLRVIDTRFGVQVNPPSTELVLTGNHFSVATWERGDHVAPTDGPYGGWGHPAAPFRTWVGFDAGSADEFSRAATGRVGQLATSVAPLADAIEESRVAAQIQAVEGERSTPAQQAATADYLAAELASYGYAVTRDPVLTSENVIARRVGSVASNRIHVIGAHFDTVPGSPGADDNGSGLGALLEIARVLADHTFEDTIELVAFGLEELAGFPGSTQYAAQLQAAGLEVRSMHSLDVIGYTCDTPGCQVPFFDIPGCLTVSAPGLDVGTFIGIVANDASAGQVARFLSAAAAFVPTLHVEWGRVAGDGSCFPNTRRSDHTPFWDLGYPAVQVAETAEFRNPNYHSATDTFDTLDLPFATDVTRATVATVAADAGYLGPAVGSPGPGACGLGSELALLLPLLLGMRYRLARVSRCRTARSPSPS